MKNDLSAMTPLSCKQGPITKELNTPSAKRGMCS